MIRLGIDTGGTFTDLVKFDEHGLAVHKVRSTPDDPAHAIFAGISELIGNGEQIVIVHGSTVATNAMLERKGARVAMVTTRGFEDVLLIGRQLRRELYNFFVEGRRPILESGLAFGITERLAPTGEVLEPLREDEVAELIHALRALEVRSIAVCLLHSYANPIHEDRVVSLLTDAGFSVSASHDVLPEYREFERFSTTVVNAYVTPLMAKYLTRLEEGLGHSLLRIMQSNGGSISASCAKAAAVRTILSGPAAGVVGAVSLGQRSGYNHLITFDMGGTSTDVSLIDGQIGMTTDSMVGDFPVRLPVLDIHTVGAGGGSIAYVDSGGALRVGPRSAGAAPGPVCYGKGDELTVTDANLLLGRLDADHFWGGRMVLDVGRVRSKAQEFAARLNMPVMKLAEGIVHIANANMERAIRAVSVQRGFDPRNFALLAFGGAGGMHACEIAESLNIGTVLIPEHGGVLSALGMLLADVKKDYSQTVLKPLSGVSDEELRARFQPIIQKARAELEIEGFQERSMLIECALDIRYKGQSYEITVPFSPGYSESFVRQHVRLYGYAIPLKALELVNLRVNGIGYTNKPVLPNREISAQPLGEPTATRTAWFGGQRWQTAFYQRELLGSGMRGHGPAIITSDQATAVVPPNFSFSIDGAGALVAQQSAAQKLDTQRSKRGAPAEP
jgi:N-methylhydantoinase A/oxoprolinase/acetone carboxylase beta subunit